MESSSEGMLLTEESANSDLQPHKRPHFHVVTIFIFTLTENNTDVCVCVCESDGAVLSFPLSPLQSEDVFFFLREHIQETQFETDKHHFFALVINCVCLPQTEAAPHHQTEHW